MPYAIAHPAAAIPLHRLLGRFSVPSALAIGCLAPDTWYLLPFLGRPDTHRASGLLICLPLGLAAYAAFHRLFKQPLLGLLPALLAAKLRAWTCEGLPRVPWTAVLASLAAGSVSHLAWDAFTHEGILSSAWPLLRAPVFAAGSYELLLYQLLQHLSTVLGACFLAWWLRQKLAATAPVRTPEPAPPWPRAAAALALAAVPAAVIAVCLLREAAVPMQPDLRGLLRLAAADATAAFAVAALLYAFAWHLCKPRM